MSGSNLTAGTWDITRTRGDIMVPDEFESEMNGSPWVVESVKAQVRVAENRFSDLVYNLPVNGFWLTVWLITVWLWRISPRLVILVMGLLV